MYREVNAPAVYFEVASVVTLTDFLLTVKLMNIQRETLCRKCPGNGVKATAGNRVGRDVNNRGDPPCVCLFSTCVWGRHVAELGRVDSHPRLLSAGPVRRPPRSAWGLAATARLPHRPHLGAGVGVPLRHSAAVSPRSRRRVAPPAAQHGPGEIRGIPPVAAGQQRDWPERGESTVHRGWACCCCLLKCSRFSLDMKPPTRHFTTILLVQLFVLWFYCSFGSSSL